MEGGCGGQILSVLLYAMPEGMPITGVHVLSVSTQATSRWFIQVYPKKAHLRFLQVNTEAQLRFKGIYMSQMRLTLLKTPTLKSICAFIEAQMRFNEPSIKAQTRIDEHLLESQMRFK